MSALLTMWSPKGGVGLSVTAAATAASFAKRDGSSVLVDLCGDQPALLGLADPSGPGVLDWLSSVDAAAESLERLMVKGPSGIDLLPVGAGFEWSSERLDELVAALAGLGREVVIDAGVHRDAVAIAEPSAEPGGAGRSALFEALASAGRSILVTSSCYLALRRAVRVKDLIDGLVVVADPGRALTGGDIADLMGAPLLAKIDRDPAIARSVDAGLFLSRPTRAIDTALWNLVASR